jgi:predicted RND superfamily exporter protein
MENSGATQEKWLREVGRFILCHSYLFLAIGAVCLALSIYSTLQFKLYDEPGRWAPQNDPLVKRAKVIEERFGGANHVVIMVTARNGDIYNHATLEKVKKVTADLLSMKGVIPYTVRSIGDVTARYMKFENRNGEDFIVNKPLMDRVPDEGDQAALDRIRWGAEHNPLIKGPLVSVSPDAKATVIAADFRTTPVKDSMGHLLPYTDPVQIYKQVNSLRERYTDSHDLIEAGGTPIIIGWVNSEGLTYVGIAFLFFLVAMAIILYLFLGRLAGAIMPILVGLFASLCGFAIYRLFFGSVLGSAAVLIAPFIVVAAGSCHAVQFLRRLFDDSTLQGVSDEDAFVDTFAMRFKPMVISLLADVMAFVVLSFVPFENVSLLGRVTTFGLISVTVAEFLILMPGLYLVMRGRLIRRVAKQKRTKMDGITEAIVRTMVKKRWAHVTVFGVVLVAFIWSAAVVSQLQFSQDNTYAIHNALTRSWRNNEIYKMEMHIREYFGGVYPLVVLAKTKGDALVNADLDVLQGMDRFEDDMKKVPGVAGTLGLPDFLKVMNRLMYGDKPEALALPSSERGVAEYVFMYEDGEPGVFDAVVSPDHQTAAIDILVRDTSKDTVSRVMTAAYAAADKDLRSAKLEPVIGGGSIAIASAFNDSIGKWLVLGTVLSMAATFVLVVVLLRSIVMPLFLVLPLVVGIFITMAIMHVVGVPMDSNMTTALAIASGVGIDSEVYLLFRFREEYALLGDFDEALIQSFTKIRRALVTSNLALIIGCWALIPIALYVGTVGFGMGLILALCFILGYFATPALWAVLRPSYLTRSTEEEMAPAEPVRSVS